jgi:negative regulator of flagellin synthesis FlgM
MKITNGNQPPNVMEHRAKQQTDHADKAKAQSAADQSASKGMDGSVQLTERAQAMQKLQETISQLPDVDSARVNIIREAITNGEYQVNPKRIAEKILAFNDDGSVPGGS